MPAPSRPIRVLQVSSGLDPRTGGTATAAIAIARASARAGLAVTLAAPVEPGAQAALAPAIADLEADGVTVMTFPFSRLGGWARGNRRAVAWGVSRPLNRFVAEQMPTVDVVHAHSVWVASSVATVAAARRAGRPVVVMPHEGLTHFDMTQASSAVLVRTKRRLRRWYLARVDRMLLSSDLERLNSGLDGDSRAAALPHPAVDERVPTPPPLPHDGYVVGFLGRFHPKKNLDVLIRAVARCANVRLKIGGGGEAGYATSLRDLALSTGAAPRIEWAGFVAPDDRGRFLASIDVLAMPSQFECFGLAAAEAMGADRPVILSPTVGLAELVQGSPAARVVPPRPDALAVAIERLAAGEPAAGARALALERFSFAAFGRRLAALYRELATI